MSGTPLRLGTRRSPLALAQSGLVAAAVTAVSGRPVDLVEITTHGDVNREPLAQIGGTGVFVSALREALLDGRIDFAVHSLKDLPTAPADELVLAAIPRREDPRDALVARDALVLAELPSGARIGTGSPRRAAQLRALGRGFEIVDIRGNVDTRIAYVTSGRLDAVVLAAAGLGRLGRLEVVTELLDPDVMLPAPGQGALAVECRAGRPEVIAALACLDDADTKVAVTSERAVLARLEAGCSAPVGVLAEVTASAGADLFVRAVVGASSEESADVFRLSCTGSSNDAVGVAHALADRLLAESAYGSLGERVT